jgi:hypothetical protein
MRWVERRSHRRFGMFWFRFVGGTRNNGVGFEINAAEADDGSRGARLGRAGGAPPTGASLALAYTAPIVFIRTIAALLLTSRSAVQPR